MYKNFSLTDKEKKEILEQHGRHGYKQPKEQISRKKKPLNEQPFGDDGKFMISHAGVPVNKIMVSVELSEDHESDGAEFTLEIGEDGNLMIVDFDNQSYGEIDDEEVKKYMESMIESGELNVPDFISFDPKTGQID
jgi:hypothetical protein